MSTPVRNALGPAYSLATEAVERLAQLRKEGCQGLDDALFYLMDLSEVLDVWSARPKPTVDRMQRTEVGQQVLNIHRLLTRAGLEFDGLHEALTKIESAIDQAQAEAQSTPMRRRQRQGVASR